LSSVGKILVDHEGARMSNPAHVYDVYVDTVPDIEQETCRRLAGDLQETCRRLAGDLQETCRRLAGDLQTIMADVQKSTAHH
jgi:hypothetical protein